MDRFYIPVGKTLTADELRQYSIEELSHRELFDPRYAGFERHFNWRRYIRLEDKGHETVREPLKQEIERALDQFASTPEGQHMIRQARAMQQYRFTGKNKQVVILAGNISSFADGDVSLNRGEIHHAEYKDISGVCRPSSLQGFLFHELSHAMDPLETLENQQAINTVFAGPINREITQIADETHKDIRSVKDLNSSQIERISQLSERFQSMVEYPAMIATAQFMKRYYNEPERALIHRDVCPSLKDFASIEMPQLNGVTHPSLNSDHLYEGILPPLPRPTVDRLPGRK